MAVSTSAPTTALVETEPMQSEADDFVPSGKSIPSSVGSHETPPPPLPLKSSDTVLQSAEVSRSEPPKSKEDVIDQPEASGHTLEENDISDPIHTSVCAVDEDPSAMNVSDADGIDDADASVFHDSDEHSPEASEIADEETSVELPAVPLFIELTDEHQRNFMKCSLERILKLYKHLPSADCKEAQMTLVARLVSQVT